VTIHSPAGLALDCAEQNDPNSNNAQTHPLVTERISFSWKLAIRKLKNRPRLQGTVKDEKRAVLLKAQGRGQLSDFFI
jgi:hypothetical protein